MHVPVLPDQYNHYILKCVLLIKIEIKKTNLVPGVAAHTCNLTNGEVEAGGLL